MSYCRFLSRAALSLILIGSLTLPSPRAAEATFAIRGTLPWHNFLSGPSAWNEEDYARYLDRLQRLGLNYVAFHCYTGGAERYATYVEPLIRMEYRDVVPEAFLDTSLTARWGYRPLAVKDFAFGTDKLFRLPPGAGAFGADAATLAQGKEDAYRRAQTEFGKVVDMAHARNLQVALGFEFGIHPPEFASIVPPDSWIRGAMVPDPTHPANIEILRHTLDDILKAYPRLDWVWFWLHEHTMYVGKPQPGPRFAELLEREGKQFWPGNDEGLRFTGVWSLAYIRQAREYLARRAPGVKLAISGWGGGNQLPGALQGLDAALPRDIVFTCLNPGQGWETQPAFLAKIAQHRPVWAIPWLEGDAQLWHLQPRVDLLRKQVGMARDQHLPGVLAIHWRTEETRANLDAFARFAAHPAQMPTVEAFYRDDATQQYGAASVEQLVPLLVKLDREQLAGAASEEYFPYHPTWGRLRPEQRPVLEAALTAARACQAGAGENQGRNLDWLAAKLEFTLLLDETGRQLEPAYRLKERRLRGEADPGGIIDPTQAALVALKQAPMEKLFGVYARSVRSRGELGELSSLNQRVWLQYRELEDFLDHASRHPGIGVP